MKLYATGMNAWNQLRFNRGATPAQPDDIYEFELIMEGQHIKPPTSTLVSTTVWCDGKYHHAGADVRTHNGQITSSLLHGPVENFAGETFSVVEDPACSDETRGRYSMIKKTRPGHAKYKGTSQVWRRTVPIAQIAAFHVGFIILYQDGTVETLGDRRFPDCLGREVDEQHPSEEPHAVHALLDLDDPVRLVVAGGYIAAALTESGALYIWGMAEPGDASKQHAIANLNHVPNYIEVDGDKDVKDVAVGESHIIALTEDDHVYVIGRNDNGQLGIGKSTPASVDSWTRINLHLPLDHNILSVTAGPRASFILVSH